MARTFSGRQLRETRRAAGIRTEALALAVERSAYTINEYEGGRVIPSLPVALKLADALGCDLDALLASEEPARVA